MMSEQTRFRTLKKLYDDDKFIELINQNDGIYWLKLRSISRKAHLQALCDDIGFDYQDIPSRDLFEQVFEIHLPDHIIDTFIQNTYMSQRANRQAIEDHLISQLYQMKVFDWGGLYQNNLEQTIVNNYIKKISDWQQLNQAIDNELHQSMQGYVQCSWYNHWSSILIEDIFNDHPNVLPTIGRVKKVDFFIHGFPFDLKVTYFPDGYLQALRKSRGLRTELSELMTFCKHESIWFDKSKSKKMLLSELLTRVEEYPKQSAKDFLDEFQGIRRELISHTLDNPTELKIWLYENQGTRRFDAANRFFLILIDLNQLENSWKLKRNKALLAPRIMSHLNNSNEAGMSELKLNFRWNGQLFETYADMLPIIV